MCSLNSLFVNWGCGHNLNIQSSKLHAGEMPKARLSGNNLRYSVLRVWLNDCDVVCPQPPTTGFSLNHRCHRGSRQRRVKRPPPFSPFVSWFTPQPPDGSILELWALYRIAWRKSFSHSTLTRRVSLPEVETLLTIMLGGDLHHYNWNVNLKQ